MFVVKWLRKNFLTTIFGFTLLAPAVFASVSYADALFAGKLLSNPYVAITGEACTESFPGFFAWHAYIHPARTSLAERKQKRLRNLIRRAGMDGGSVTEEEKQEFIKILSPLKFRVRLMRGKNVLAKCSFEPDLSNSAYLNGKGDTRPTIRISWNENCRLADGGEISVEADDTLSLFERDSLMISAKLRRCETDCGIIDCR